MTYNEKPIGWKTRTFWVHLAANILASATVTSGKPWHRSTIVKNALKKTDQEKLEVDNPEVAIGYALHYLKRAKLIAAVGRGVYCITELGASRVNDREQVMWAVFAEHRKYAAARLGKKVKISGSRTTIIQTIREKLQECQNALRQLEVTA